DSLWPRPTGSRATEAPRPGPTLAEALLQPHIGGDVGAAFAHLRQERIRVGTVRREEGPEPPGPGLEQIVDAEGDRRARARPIFGEGGDIGILIVGHVGLGPPEIGLGRIAGDGEAPAEPAQVLAEAGLELPVVEPG